MSGNGAMKRKYAMAKRVAKLAQEGMTSKEIAALVGIKPELVKSKVLLGERLLSLEGK